MNNDEPTTKARLRAFLLDWLIWAYVPVAILYYFHKAVVASGLATPLYLGALVLGLILAVAMEATGNTIGKRLSGLLPEEPLEERGKEKRAPWYKTQIGLTGALLAAVTLVLGWHVTEINLYYVFTRAEKMRNMTDRLTRPYWPVFGTLIEKMIETIFLALMATVAAIPLAAIVSFFAARNLMYRVTARWGSLLGGFTVAVLGAWLSLAVIRLLLAPLQDTNIDVKLLGGILSPLSLLVGLLLFGYLGLTLTHGILELRRKWLVSGVATALSGLLGAGAAYLLASLVATVVFAGSWRIFVRDFSPWPYVVLLLGLAAGLWLASRRDPAGEFPIGALVYGVIRFILNATRSIEPFVWALIFVTWFRLGPFPGMVALMVHSIAALGKLYSEQVESIDPGPLEAVRAAGANELQTVVYAVIPQIIPPFISFTIYRWDINVRMSTIIGLVGGGGIGQMLFQYQNLGQWRKTSVAVILIVAIVMTLDNISAKIRERII